MPVSHHRDRFTRYAFTWNEQVDLTIPTFPQDHCVISFSPLSLFVPDQGAEMVSEMVYFQIRASKWIFNIS